MRRLINRFACMLIGHDWRVTREFHYETHVEYGWRCQDCGREREFYSR
jgi:hypothetical protein